MEQSAKVEKEGNGDFPTPVDPAFVSNLAVDVNATIPTLIIGIPPLAHPSTQTQYNNNNNIPVGRETRNRGLSSIDNSISWKRAWTDEEDNRLRELTQIHGTSKWALIAESFQERTGKQCRERWHNHLAPQIKKGDWEEDEDAIIVTLQRQHGNQWSLFSRYLSGRTDNAIKNRFHVIQRAMKGGRGPDLSRTAHFRIPVPVNKKNLKKGAGAGSGGRNTNTSIGPDGVIFNENNYEGTAGDVVGKAIGYSYGPAFKFEYVLLVPVKGKEMKITFDDWIFKQDDRVAINRATMTKFGFKVAELTVVFVKD